MKVASIRPNVKTTRPSKQSLVRKVSVTSRSTPVGSFKRAELVFDGVDHSDVSFEALIYFNNPKANHKTGRRAETGYVGSFDIFGHGQCFGAPGHCAVPNRLLRHGDLREPHPLTPVQKRIVVTEALKYVLSRDARKLSCVTIVPVIRAMGRKPKQAAGDLLKFGKLSLKMC